MTEQALIAAIADEVRSKLDGESSGHDWWHIHRVWQMTRRLGQHYNVDLLVVELAALLHDIADWKLHSGDEMVGPRVARLILEKHQVQEDVIRAVCSIISEISFKGARVPSEPSTMEGKIVQDADRLDALGAIGVARAFAYGGYVRQTMHDPETQPVIHMSKEEYISNRSSTINHFHEKLFHLVERMNTKEAKGIASNRHEFMQEYIRRFHQEWDGLV
jgi:uncharacterized protein